MDKKFDRKLFLLVATTMVVVFGIAFFSSPDASPLFRYVIAILGQTLIIAITLSIGIERVKAFTLESSMGKSLAYILFGILIWGLGNMAWFYYNAVANIEVPYPSLADAGFVGMIPFAAYGLFLLLRSIDIKFGAGTMIKLVLLPIASFLVTYKLFIEAKLAEDVPALVKALNVIYPVGDAIFLSLALVILSMVWGGKMSLPIGILCLGFIVEAMADFAFSWTTTAGTYYTGSWTDILFALAFFTVGVGMYYMNVLITEPAKSKRYAK